MLTHKHAVEETPLSSYLCDDEDRQGCEKESIAGCIVYARDIV